MRKRYSFSSRRTKKIENIRKQRQKYPDISDKIIENSDIIMEVLDARFIEDTRNLGVEEKIFKKNKRIIYIINKSDLLKRKDKAKIEKLKPNALISCKKRTGIKNLRELIKRESKKIKREERNFHKTIIGIIGYPNTGKSSLINLLIGKSSAGVGSDAGFTKGIQKLRLSDEILLLDSPGVIPREEYSSSEKDKIAKHTKVSARSFSQVKEPEMVINILIKEFPNVLEKFYKINAKGDSEILIEELGKQKGFFKKKGIIDEDKTSRLILKDWQSGEIKV